MLSTASESRRMWRVYDLEANVTSELMRDGSVAIMLASIEYVCFEPLGQQAIKLIIFLTNLLWHHFPPVAGVHEEPGRFGCRLPLGCVGGLPFV